MPYIRTDDGVKIYYEQHGEGSPLALAYGVGGNADMWAPNVEALARRHRLILWEPRGHARSDSPRDPARYSMRRWALDLRDLLDALGVRRAHVGGLSLGGGVATRFARFFPERVSSLLVIDSASTAGLPQPVPGLKTRVRIIELALSRGMDVTARYVISSMPIYAATVRRDPKARAQFMALFRKLDPIGYASSLRALLHVEDFRHELPQIRTPTLLICGDEDPALPSMRTAHRLIKRSRLKVIASAGHFTNRDQPEAFNRAVLTFLSQVDRRR